MEKEQDIIQEHYVALVRWVKNVLEDDRLSAEAKIKILGNAL